MMFSLTANEVLIRPVHVDVNAGGDTHANVSGN